MEIVFTEDAYKQLQFWKKSGNKKIQASISQLIADISVAPYSGIGKPEQLKYNLSGYWSRRITSEHRLVYYVKDDLLYIISLRFHYDK